ncbi:hypothetical protein VL20_4631 [Microcystis panniformis FACHB-1757]|uniref:Uncharacterized protein n=1 Tax=Microcystis panniformis FACHB-1757 TaxID=1638788 RepID=A0A0K1S5W4_9CHRO|nr:hypothetical protein VL20_4631 [Microcystis panniformis FACHB-1757]
MGYGLFFIDQKSVISIQYSVVSIQKTAFSPCSPAMARLSIAERRTRSSLPTDN